MHTRNTNHTRVILEIDRIRLFALNFLNIQFKPSSHCRIIIIIIIIINSIYFLELQKNLSTPRYLKDWQRNAIEEERVNDSGVLLIIRRANRYCV